MGRVPGTMPGKVGGGAVAGNEAGKICSVDSSASQEQLLLRMLAG